MAQFDFEKVKDEVIANLEELVTDTAKNELVGWFKNKALPYAEEVADAYVVALKKQGEAEEGWMKIRDAVVLPALINVAEYAVKKTLELLGKQLAEDEKKPEAPAETVTTIS